MPFKIFSHGPSVPANPLPPPGPRHKPLGEETRVSQLGQESIRRGSTPVMAENQREDPIIGLDPKVITICDKGATFIVNLVGEKSSMLRPFKGTIKAELKKSLLKYLGSYFSRREGSLAEALHGEFRNILSTIDDKFKTLDGKEVLRASEFNRASTILIEGFIPKSIIESKIFGSFIKSFLGTFIVPRLSDYLFYLYKATDGSNTEKEEAKLAEIFGSKEPVNEISHLCKKSANQIMQLATGKLARENKEKLQTLIHGVVNSYGFDPSEVEPFVEGLVLVIEAMKTEGTQESLFGERIEKFIEKSLFRVVYNVIEEMPEESKNGLKNHPDQALKEVFELFMNKLKGPFKQALNDLDQNKPVTADIPNALIDILFKDIKTFLPLPPDDALKVEKIIKEKLAPVSASFIVSIHETLNSKDELRKKLTENFNGNEAAANFLALTKTMATPLLAQVFKTKQTEILRPLKKELPEVTHFHGMIKGLLEHLGKATEEGNGKELFDAVGVLAEPFLMNVLSNAAVNIKELDKIENLLEEITVSVVRVAKNHFERLKVAKEALKKEGKQITFEAVQEKLLSDQSAHKGLEGAFKDLLVSPEGKKRYQEYSKELSKKVIQLLNVKEQDLKFVPVMAQGGLHTLLETVLLPLIAEESLIKLSEKHTMVSILDAIFEEVEADTPVGDTKKGEPKKKVSFDDDYQKKLNQSIKEVINSYLSLQKSTAASIGKSLIDNQMIQKKIIGEIGGAAREELKSLGGNEDILSKVAFGLQALTKFFQKPGVIQEILPDDIEADKKRLEGILEGFPKRLNTVIEKKARVDLVKKLNSLKKTLLSPFKHKYLLPIKILLSVLLEVTFFLWARAIAFPLNMLINALIQLSLAKPQKENLQIATLPHADCFIEAIDEVLKTVLEEVKDV